MRLKKIIIAPCFLFHRIIIIKIIRITNVIMCYENTYMEPSPGVHTSLAVAVAMAKTPRRMTSRMPAPNPKSRSKSEAESAVARIAFRTRTYQQPCVYISGANVEKKISVTGVMGGGDWKKRNVSVRVVCGSCI